VTIERRIWDIAGIVLTGEKQVIENIFVSKTFCPAQIESKPSLRGKRHVTTLLD
jgi:hypothetical protein